MRRDDSPRHSKAGAAGKIVKPFSLPKLLARARGALRRSAGPEPFVLCVIRLGSHAKMSRRRSDTCQADPRMRGDSRLGAQPAIRASEVQTGARLSMSVHVTSSSRSG